MTPWVSLYIATFYTRGAFFQLPLEIFWLTDIPEMILVCVTFATTVFGALCRPAYGCSDFLNSKNISPVHYGFPSQPLSFETLGAIFSLQEHSRHYNFDARTLKVCCGSLRALFLHICMKQNIWIGFGSLISICLKNLWTKPTAANFARPHWVLHTSGALFDGSFKMHRFHWSRELIVAHFSWCLWLVCRCISLRDRPFHRIRKKSGRVAYTESASAKEVSKTRLNC